MIKLGHVGNIVNKDRWHFRKSEYLFVLELPCSRWQAVNLFGLKLSSTSDKLLSASIQAVFIYLSLDCFTATPQAV